MNKRNFQVRAESPKNEEFELNHQIITFDGQTEVIRDMRDTLEDQGFNTGEELTQAMLYCLNDTIHNRLDGIEMQNKKLLDILKEKNSQIQELQRTISDLTNQLSKFHNDFKQVEENKQQLLEKKNNNKRKKKKQPLRDVIDLHDLKQILNISKQNKTTDKVQNRVGIVMLFLLGVRITELQQITWKNIKNYLNGEVLYIAPGKSKLPVKIGHYASEKAVQIFNQLIGTEFYDKLNFVNELEKVFPCSREHLNRTINGILKAYGKLSGKNVLSHSCRISFITRISQVAGVQHAQQLVGHQNIATTQRYNRYRLSVDLQKEVLNQSLELSLATPKRGRPYKGK